MNPWRWVDPRVRSIRLANVQEYFRRQGWRLTPNPNPGLLRFEKVLGKKGPPFSQVFPAEEEEGMFPRYVTELITTLSELEDRHPIDVLNDMLAAGQAQEENGLEKRSRKKPVRK